MSEKSEIKKNKTLEIYNKIVASDGKNAVKDLCSAAGITTSTYYGYLKTLKRNGLLPVKQNQTKQAPKVTQFIVHNEGEHQGKVNILIMNGNAAEIERIVRELGVCFK